MYVPSLNSHSTSQCSCLTPAGVYYPMIIWGLTFTAVMTIILSLGFGPKGIVAGEAMMNYLQFQVCELTDMCQVRVLLFSNLWCMARSHLLRASLQFSLG